MPVKTTHNTYLRGFRSEMARSLIAALLAAAVLPTSSLAQVQGQSLRPPNGAQGQLNLPESDRAPAAPSDASQIVVRGTVERRSSWRRAEGAHVVVFSNGSEGELRRLVANIDSLDALLSRLFKVRQGEDRTRKLELTLIGDRQFFDAMRLRNERSAEGPFPEPFDKQRYYAPRETGPVAAIGREDQQIELSEIADDTSADAGVISDQDDGSEPDSDGFDAGDSFNADPFANRSPMTSAFHVSPVPMPGTPRLAIRPWQALAYSTYAQHFFLTRLPAAYPRWFLDGIGALFSTFTVRKDGALEYGRTPERFQTVLDAYGEAKIADVLTGRYPVNGKVLGWTPYQAWLLTDFFLLGDTAPGRRAQLRSYLASVAQGRPLSEAATAFGDLDVLAAEIKRYAAGKTYHFALKVPVGDAAQPLVERLPVDQAAVLEARVELDARLAVAGPVRPTASPDADAKFAKDLARSLARREAFLARLRKLATRAKDGRSAGLLLAEATCRSGLAAECRGAAESVLKLDPSDAGALAWKGVALLLQTQGQPDEKRKAGVAEARAVIAAAIRGDNDALIPLIAYFRTFTDPGIPASRLAVAAMLKAIAEVPAAPQLRLALAGELNRQGIDPAAQKTLLLPVAAGGYDSPERAPALSMLTTIGAGVRSSQPTR